MMAYGDSNLEPGIWEYHFLVLSAVIDRVKEVKVNAPHAQPDQLVCIATEEYLAKSQFSLRC